jgi:hypothetical protein
MEVKQNILDELKGKNPFILPEGYMEGLTEQIMGKIPEVTYRETKVISLYDRIRPWLYVASVFLGLLILFRVFIYPTAQNKEPQKETSSYLQAFIYEDLLQIISDDDLDFLEYMESQHINRKFAEEIDNMDY